jgi:hypothetical protein
MIAMEAWILGLMSALVGFIGIGLGFIWGYNKRDRQWK